MYNAFTLIIEPRILPKISTGVSLSESLTLLGQPSKVTQDTHEKGCPYSMTNYIL